MLGLNLYNLTRKRASGKSMFAAIALIALVMTGLVVWSPQATAFAASTPNMSVDPPYVASNDVFSIDIKLSDIVDTMKLVGFEFKLRYDPNQLEVLEVGNGTFLEAFAGSPNGGMLYYHGPSGADYVMLGGLILPDKEGIWHGAFPSGSGTIASITFKVIHAPPTGSTGCDLTLFATKLGDLTAKSIAHTVTNGRYEFIGPIMSVDPSVYVAEAVGETFSVDIKLSGVSTALELVGFEFMLSYDPTLLEIVEVENGTFLEAFAGPPSLGVKYYGPVYEEGSVLLGGLILPDVDGVWNGPFPSGDGTIASITFKTKPQSTGASCDLALLNTKLGDQEAEPIAHTVKDGHYGFLFPVMAVDPPSYDATAVGETFSVDIRLSYVSAVLELVGFEFTLGYDPTLLEVMEVENGTFLEAFAGPPSLGMFYLGPVYGSNYVVFAGFIQADEHGVWNGPFPSGDGTIATVTFKTKPQSIGSACDLALLNTKLGDPEAESIAHFTMDGHYSMTVSALRGDLNSDARVDIFDALILAMAFGTSPGHPQWNSVADLIKDDSIDILDAIVLSNNFGKSA